MTTWTGAESVNIRRTSGPLALHGVPGVSRCVQSQHGRFASHSAAGPPSNVPMAVVSPSAANEWREPSTLPGGQKEAPIRGLE